MCVYVCVCTRVCVSLKPDPCVSSNCNGVVSLLSHENHFQSRRNQIFRTNIFLDVDIWKPESKHQKFFSVSKEINTQKTQMQLFKPSIKWLARQQCVLYLFLCVESVYILMKPVTATDTFQEVQQHFAKNKSFFKFTFKLKAYFFSFIKKNIIT